METVDLSETPVNNVGLSETPVNNVEHGLKLLKASRFRRENTRYRRRIGYTEAKSTYREGASRD